MVETTQQPGGGVNFLGSLFSSIGEIWKYFGKVVEYEGLKIQKSILESKAYSDWLIQSDDGAIINLNQAQSTSQKNTLLIGAILLILIVSIVYLSRKQ